MHVGVGARDRGLILQQLHPRVIVLLGRDYFVREQGAVALPGKLRVLEVGLGLLKIGFSLQQQVSQVDVLDLADHFAPLDAIALERRDLRDSAPDAAGDVDLRRLEHPDHVDPAPVRVREQIGAHEEEGPSGDRHNDANAYNSSD